MSTLIVVTGASRGIGLSICTSFAAKLSSSPLHFLLLARSEPNLAAAASSIASSYTGSSSELTIESHSVNFSDPVSTSKCESILKAIPWSSTASTILVNNAGSLGDLTVQSIAPNLADLTTTINLNVTSPIYLTSLFLSQLPPTLVPQTQIINISSLAAVQPFPTWSVYCAGKAARDMYFKTVAAEVHHGASLQGVLNYAPGPVDTDMQREIRGAEGCDEGTRKYFVEAKEKETLVKPDDTARKLVEIVCGGKYESGAHVDYFDEVK